MLSDCLHAPLPNDCPKLSWLEPIVDCWVCWTVDCDVCVVGIAWGEVELCGDWADETVGDNTVDIVFELYLAVVCWLSCLVDANCEVVWTVQTSQSTVQQTQQSTMGSSQLNLGQSFGSGACRQSESITSLIIALILTVLFR
jgi:hypothetical protein